MFSNLTWCLPKSLFIYLSCFLDFGLRVCYHVKFIVMKSDIYFRTIFSTHTMQMDKMFVNVLSSNEWSSNALYCIVGNDIYGDVLRSSCLDRWLKNWTTLLINPIHQNFLSSCLPPNTEKLEYWPWTPRCPWREANLNSKLEIWWLLTYWQHTSSDEMVLSWEDKRLAHHELYRTIDFLFPNTTTTYFFMILTSFWIV